MAADCIHSIFHMEQFKRIKYIEIINLDRVFASVKFYFQLWNEVISMRTIMQNANELVKMNEKNTQNYLLLTLS